jgi:hypothetical protein
VGLSSSHITSLFHTLGGVQKVIELTSTASLREIIAPDTLPRLATDMIARKAALTSGAIAFGVSVFGSCVRGLDVFRTSLQVKRLLQETFLDSDTPRKVRSVVKPGQDMLPSALFTQQMARSLAEVCLLPLPPSYAGHIGIGTTVATHNIHAYSARDYGKTADMKVGMMPPKLCQIMINLARTAIPQILPISLSSASDTSFPSPFSSQTLPIIYDPFVGFGSVLIEAMYMGIADLVGSDIDAQLVEATRKNLLHFVAELSRAAQKKYDQANSSPYENSNLTSPGNNTDSAHANTSDNIQNSIQDNAQNNALDITDKAQDTIENSTTDNLPQVSPSASPYTRESSADTYLLSPSSFRTLLFAAKAEHMARSLASIALSCSSCQEHYTNMCIVSE